MPRDAEAWLAERGVAREAIRLTPRPEEVAAAVDDTVPAGDAPLGAAPVSGGPVGDLAASETPDGTAPVDRAAAGGGREQPGHGPPPSSREVAQLAAAAAHAADDAAAQTEAQRPVGGPSLSDDVAAALAFVRRSTANAPQSVGRLRDKLTERGTTPQVTELALERAHAEGLVDDAAMAAALVDEGRAKGHAPTRLRADLTRRGFDAAVIAEALSVTEGEDLSAAAFALARQRAERLTAVAAETAVRRIVGQLARRGYPEALARKVARDAVFATREDARTAGR